MEDFSSLGSLPSLGVGLSSENPSWNRNLFEIKAASDSLWTSNQSPSRAGDMPRTSSLLGSRNLPDLGVSSGKPPQRAESDFLRWGEANRRQEVDILKRMVKKAEQSTRKKTQDLIEKQLQEDWERTRDLFSKQLVGSRTLGGSATNKAPVTNDNLLLLESSVGQAPVPTSGLGQRVQDPMARQINPQAAHSHLAIVKRLQQNGQNNFKLMSEAANEFAKIAESCGSDSPQYRYYSTTLQLTSRILARKDFSPVEISMATLDYFSNQFEYYMLSQNRTATLPVQGGSQEASSVHRAHYKNTNANTIAVFASTELGRSIEASFWPCLYYGKLFVLMAARTIARRIHLASVHLAHA